MSGVNTKQELKQELIEFLMRDGYVDMDILRRVFEVLGRAVGDRNQALADRDARIGELEKCSDTMAGLYAGAIRQLAVANDSHDATKTQLARVVGALRELRGETCGGIGCVSVKTRDDVDAILKEFEDAK